MEHTPGTWVAEMYSMPTGADDFECGASVFADDGSRRREVAFVKELPEQEANARLIAAAPEMLEAMKAHLKETNCDGDLCNANWHEKFRQIIHLVEPDWSVR